MRAPFRPALAATDRRAIALGVFVVAFVVRWLWAVKVQSPLTALNSDMGQYVHRAELLLAGKAPGDPRVLAFYPWGTHVLLAAEFALFGRSAAGTIAVVHALVGAIAAPCTALLAARFVGSRLAVAAAGLLVAVWHPHVVYSGFFSSEIWFSAAIALNALLVVRHREGRSGALGGGITAAVAFVVRPQFVLTWAFLAGLAALRSWRIRRRRILTVLALGLPIAAAMVASAVRLYKLSGHVGLISENAALQRLFGETDVTKVESVWTAPDGSRWTYWVSPPGMVIREESTVKFEGFFSDPTILAGIRDERLRDVTLGARLARMSNNVALLSARMRPWPESEYESDRRRAILQRVFARAIYVVLPLAILGAFAMRRHRVAALVVVANLFTILFVAALYRGEPRYRVPYDPFLLLLAVLGAHQFVLAVIEHRRSRKRAAAPPSG